HQGRQVQRSSTFILTMVVAGLVLVATFVPAILLSQPESWIFRGLIGIGSLGAAGILLSMRIALQWDRAIILRLGRFHSLKGPGIFWLVPIVDKVARYVDMRIRATEFFSERTLTKDTVPVNVDAICFWLIWDAQKAVLEVENYYRAIVLS